MVVERGVTLGNRLQLIVEVDNDFAQRQHEMQFNAIAANIFLVDKFASLIHAKFHYRPNIVNVGNDRRPDVGFFYMVYHRWVGQSRRVMHLAFVAHLIVHHVRNVGHRGDDIHVKLAV